MDLVKFFLVWVYFVREQIIFKAELSPALHQERLSHWVCETGGRLSAHWLQASLHSTPLRGVLFTDVGSSQTVSGLQPLGLGEHLAEWDRACLGSCTCYFSAGGFVSPSSDHTQLAVLQLSTRGQTCTPHSFEGCGASP